MRFDFRRGVTLALGLFGVLALAAGASAQTCHTIPRLVPAVDLNTGEPYYAPPVPYGHYAGKDCLGKLGRHAGGLLHGGLLGGKGCGICGGCGGKGCGACGGSGQICGDGLGNGAGGCGGKGCGLFHHGHADNGGTVAGLGDPCGVKGCGLFHGNGGHHGLGSGCGLCGGKGCGACAGHASTIVASGQTTMLPATVLPVSSAQAYDPGCGDPGCKDPGCAKKCGLFGKGCGLGDPCKSCGGKGCGLCGLGKGCGLCGGRGCNACAKARGLLRKLCGADKIEWFVGAGGPVPLTPGYTPYVVTTRSPRDFFAFPPMTP